MVNDQGQLFTIEGVAAAVLMIFTTYITLSATTIYTPGDTHVIDMQLEQLGNDVLAMMDTANSFNWSATTNYSWKQSDLERYVMESNCGGFRSQFNQSINYLWSGPDKRPIDFNAKVYYLNNTGTVKSYYFTNSSQLTDTELFVAAHPVTVTRWVYLNGNIAGTSCVNVPGDFRNAPQTVLFEVTLWRD